MSYLYFSSQNNTTYEKTPCYISSVLVNEY